MGPGQAWLLRGVRRLKFHLKRNCRPRDLAYKYHPTVKGAGQGSLEKGLTLELLRGMYS